MVKIWNAISVNRNARKSVYTIVVILHLLPRLLLRPLLGQSPLTILALVLGLGVDWHGWRTQQRLGTAVSLPITYWLAIHADASLPFRRFLMYRFMQLVKLPLYQIIEVLILIY